MHDYAMTGNILQHSCIGRGPAANIVLRLQPVDGNDDCQFGIVCPFRRNLAKGAGNDLNEDVALTQLGQENRQLAKAHQWISTDDRQM